jgi:release factor glutamine methyltransferase
MNLRQALTTAAAQLAAVEDLRDQAFRDAELLLLHSLQISRVTSIAYPERELSAEQQALYQSAIDRRLSLEPIQYITGQQEFYGLTLKVTPAVLIPRPETEHLVEAVLHHFANLPQDRTFRLADIGTGSGAIAIALAVHLPQARITAVDLSPPALAVAEGNARAHNVGHRIRFLQSDLLAALHHGSAAAEPASELAPTSELFDAIVSNPPYIPESERPTLHPQVRDHEPSTALFAGESGLEIYRRLIPEAYAALKPNGLLALEIGHGQSESLTTLLHGWDKLFFIKDLQQIPRVALALRP